MTLEHPNERIDRLGSSRSTPEQPASERSSATGQPTGKPDIPSSLVHLYRAEVGRAVSWRQRLDVTTNWAVVTTGAGMTFALGAPDSQRHVVILLSSILTTFFLIFETRRYRHYHLWQTRVFMIESEIYAPWLDPERFHADPRWETSLALELRHPRYRLSFLEALGARLWRNYLWLYIANLLVWFVKVAIHPVPAASFHHFIERAAVGPVSGWAMVVIGILFNGSLILITLLTRRSLRERGEITEF